MPLVSDRAERSADAGLVDAQAQAPTAAQLRSQAFAQAYNLDYPEAVASFDKALALDPNDSATHRARATATWLHIIFRRGSITVDQYLGGASRSDLKLEKPPAADADTFQRHLTRALELAERRLAANPKDVSALYDVGAAVGLQASYAATVEGRVGGAFRAARRAYDTHERVMALDPSRKDAGLIVGTYRYVVATLSLPARWVAYLAGFGGDKSKGLHMIEEAARYPGDTQVDAKFALMLLYNREGRFEEALAVIRELMARFPRNRVLRLEAGATAIRARQYSEADRLLTAGHRRPAGRSAAEGLWRRGDVVLQAGHGAPGAAAPRAGARRPDARRPACPCATGSRRACNWRSASWRISKRDAPTRGPPTARRSALGEAGNDPETADEARRWMKTAYK